MKVFMIALSLTLCSTILQAKVITCQRPEAIGIPVVQLKIENNSVLEARELFQSNITGNLSPGKKLIKIPDSNKNINLFHLDSKYTEDYSLIVNFETNPFSVTIESIDRDDWTVNSTVLVNCN